MSAPRVVVVGAGLAGLRTAESLRDRGFAGEIVLVGEETHRPYDRPPLSKHVLRGEREPFFLRPDDEWDALDVDLRLGLQATGLDVTAQRVRTTDGDLPYDVLVIATGAAARRLPGSPGLVLRTLDDAVTLRDQLLPGRRLGVVGAGLVGCEVAASARAMGVEVSLVDVLTAPLVRVLGGTVSGLVADLHRAHGVDLHLGVGVTQASGHQLILSDGTEFEVDVLLEALGAAPDTAWLEGALPLDNGVSCDANGRVTENVYAVGDVANWGGRRVEHWTSAGEQAAVVAAQVVGAPVEHDPVHYWWSDQYDVKLQGLGEPAADDDVEVLEAGPRKRTVAVYSRGGQLTGLVGFSAAGVIMKLRPLVQAGAPVDQVLAALRA